MSGRLAHSNDHRRHGRRVRELPEEARHSRASLFVVCRSLHGLDIAGVIMQLDAEPTRLQ